jgi:hypothetical protein
MKQLTYLFLIMILSGKSQEVFSSKTYINTCYNNQQCFSLNSSSHIFYQQDNHELIIVIDFSKFKTGHDTLDAWLDDLDDTKLIFRGYLNTENLLELSHHNSKAMIVNGMMTFNNISHSHAIELTLFELPRDGMLFMENQNNYYDRINANLQFSFYPKEFKINKKPHHLKKKITLAIYRGYVNPFKMGMEHWISN